MELMSCPRLAVPNDVMQHVVHVESSYNPYAIGVVGGRLARQPRNLAEALATVRMLEGRGYNFSLGLAQVNRYNLARYGLDTYERAFETCPNVLAGSRILAECYGRSGGDWGKSFSCYYSGNFTTGFRHGYVQKVFASMRDAGRSEDGVGAIDVIGRPPRKVAASSRMTDADRQQLQSLSPSRVPTGPRRLVPARSSDAPPRVGTNASGGPAAATEAVGMPELPPAPGDQAFVF